MRKTSAVHNAQRHSFTSGPVYGPLLDLHCFPFGPGLDAFHWICVGFIALTSGPLCFIAPTSGPVWADSFHFWTWVEMMPLTSGPVWAWCLTSGPVWASGSMPFTGPVWASLLSLLDLCASLLPLLDLCGLILDLGDDTFDFWACVGLVPHFWTCMGFIAFLLDWA